MNRGIANRGMTNRGINEKTSIYIEALNCFAEKEGFEPPDRINGQRFSRPPHSTTLPFLPVQKYNNFVYPN